MFQKCLNRLTSKHLLGMCFLDVLLILRFLDVAIYFSVFIIVTGFLKLPDLWALSFSSDF